MAQWAAENYGPLPDCGQIMLDNDAYWGEQLGVWSRDLTNWAKTAGSPSGASMLDTGLAGEMPWVRYPTTWTVFQQDGPHHLGLC